MHNICQLQRRSRSTYGQSQGTLGRKVQSRLHDSLRRRLTIYHFRNRISVILICRSFHRSVFTDINLSISAQDSRIRIDIRQQDAHQIQGQIHICPHVFTGKPIRKNILGAGSNLDIVTRNRTVDINNSLGLGSTAIHLVGIFYPHDLISRSRHSYIAVAPGRNSSVLRNSRFHRVTGSNVHLFQKIRIKVRIVHVFGSSFSGQGYIPGGINLPVLIDNRRGQHDIPRPGS